jgi:DNA repair protein RecN (Recombination protein N)
MVFVQNRLEELSPILPDAKAWKQEASGIAISLQELADTVSRAATRIEGDPARLQWLEDRMSEVHKLKRKYGGSVEAILAHLDTCKQQLRELETRGERIAELDRGIAAARADVKAVGGTLSQARRKCATGLAKAIISELKELGFPHGQFFIDLQDSEPRLSGLDAIEFGFAPNVGEPARPLRLIASSGEISRIMLAIKAVVARHDRIPVLIFDEIDANVGGEMGTAIGAKLDAVAQTHQVLCITHLPQVAVYGKAHYVVRKEVSEGRTHTLIATVEGEARAEEVARMLGGKDLTSVTLRHAREMLKRR